MGESMTTTPTLNRLEAYMYVTSNLQHDSVERLCIYQNGTGKDEETQEANHVEYISRFKLQETIILMGCKTKDAMILTNWIFGELAILQLKNAGIDSSTASTANGLKSIEYNDLLNHIYAGLERLSYSHHNKLLHFSLAKEICQRKRFFILLLAGTSGSGKSTLSSLLATRLGINTILSTDSIRHLLRSFTSKEEHPCLFKSTYNAGEAIPPEESDQQNDETCDTSNGKKVQRKRTLRGYKVQSNIILKHLDNLLGSLEQNKQSAIVEGVHLRCDQMAFLVKKHPSCIPFLLYISNEMKHRECFAIRGRYMTLDVQQNKYIQYFNEIRTIQKYLCKSADKTLLPKIDNTNVDRSLATIQSTLIRVLQKIYSSPENKILDDNGKFVLLSREYESITRRAWSSTRMRTAMKPFIQQKVSKRILLKRLLMEQTDIDNKPHGEENSSSSSSEEDDHEDNEHDGEKDEQEDDEHGTLVGSLLSPTTFGAKIRIPFDDDSINDEEETKECTKRQIAFTSAIEEAERWRSGRTPRSIDRLGIVGISEECKRDFNDEDLRVQVMRDGVFKFHGITELHSLSTRNNSEASFSDNEDDDSSDSNSWNAMPTPICSPTGSFIQEHDDDL